MEIPLIEYKLFESYGDRIQYAITSRHGGVSSPPYDTLNFAFNVDDERENVEQNYENFCKKSGFIKEKIVFSDQPHTDKTAIIKEGVSDFKNPLSTVDAFITKEKGIPISVRFADCQGVLIFDPEKEVIAAIHSGWKGNAQNIIGKTVRKMIDEFECNPKNLLVIISPSLGPCCAEFQDPLHELPSEMHKYIDEYKVDLWACTDDQLLDEGILGENIENPRICTMCNQDRFFSYRGSGGVCGRMMGLISLK
ncbi:peptidoglycan editing factor PgeF [Patescibacteria group bacterium]